MAKKIRVDRGEKLPANMMEYGSTSAKYSNFINISVSTKGLNKLDGSQIILLSSLVEV